jgi:hypothetical protein
VWVLGLEADGEWQQLIQHSFVRFGSNPAAGAPMGSVATDTAYFRSEQDALGTFRGQVGWSAGRGYCMRWAASRSVRSSIPQPKSYQLS